MNDKKLELVTNNKGVKSMSKKPISTQLLEEQHKNAELLTQIDILKADIEKLKKNNESDKKTSTMWYEEKCKLEKEIEQIHQFLDAAPKSVARESEGENSYSTVKRTAMTRLAAWLASRG